MVGWTIADHIRTELAEDALKYASAPTMVEPRAIFHSDCGRIEVNHLHCPKSPQQINPLGECDGVGHNRSHVSGGIKWITARGGEPIPGTVGYDGTQNLRSA